ncbi:membrane protein DedA with SNARE-associated domain [Pseudonocardia sediminis]|uniref:Membrane protein DedA with SNARE-associated domain n=1 Tax=Pseudonocardia sediminis TaxID=1397368 RepID=A0A4Q7UV81_PSEST|nr:DedA family protein [Pseudonocardia sediminis]RZT85822.1 membrane protein DedA with SNARE-associated domain [Pseudonocardia sediminis]
MTGANEETADGGATPPETTKQEKPSRFRWRSKDYSPEEMAEAKKAWRDAMPWDHPMSRGDKVLVFSTLGVIVLMLASMPFRPFLLASHPIALSAVTGSLSAIGAGAAFARIGQGELWLVVAAGVFGMIKFDWLFWLAGRRWGAKVVEMFAPGDVAKRVVSRIRSWPAWAMPLVVIAAALPGIPAPAVFAVAGLGGMGLVRFLIFDAIGAALITGLVAGLGYGVGQYAVDVVLMIDEYALWITLTLVVLVSFRAGYRGYKEDKEKKARAAGEAA